MYSFESDLYSEKLSIGSVVCGPLYVFFVIIIIISVACAFLVDLEPIVRDSN